MPSAKLLLLFVGKALGLFRVAQWLTRKHLKILCYHGFALGDEAAFRPKLFITSGQFQRRLATIRRRGYCVLPLDDALEKLYAHALPDHAVVITVDDGFYSFHRLAVPCLRDYEYPATVYVTTYYVEKCAPIFRLVVQYMFWKTHKRELVLRDVPWSASTIIDLSDRTEAERAMWACIDYGEQGCTEEARSTICEELGALLETPYADIVRSKILHLMSPDELRSLAAASVDVQLHTHRHVFPKDDQVLAEREIVDNRNALKRWLRGERKHFCYPSGLWHQHQWAWLDGMNVASSTTCMPGLNTARTPRHALHRFLDGENIHQLEFEAALSGFSDLARALRRGVMQLGGRRDGRVDAFHRLATADPCRFGGRGYSSR